MTVSTRWPGAYDLLICAKVTDQLICAKVTDQV
jgi:hypothetical protein